MKVVLFIHETKGFVASLANGMTYEPKAKETKEKFLARLDKMVKDDLMDTVELEEFDIKALRRLATPTLETMVLGLDGLGEEMIRGILDKRNEAKAGAGTPAESLPATSAAKVDPVAAKAAKDAEKAKAAKEKEEAKAKKDAEKAEAKAKKDAEKAEAKAKKDAEKAEKAEKAPKKTLEEVQAAALEARANIGKAFDFELFDEEAVVTGVVNNVVVDKRGPIALYRFKMPDGSFKHKSVFAEITYNEAVTKEVQAAVAAAEAEKAARKGSTAKGANAEHTKALKAVERARKAADKAKAKYEELENAVVTAQAAADALAPSTDQADDLSA